jgi:hypothetical protein
LSHYESFWWSDSFDRKLTAAGRARWFG